MEMQDPIQDSDAMMGTQYQETDVVQIAMWNKVTLAHLQ